ncbi:MAG: hypothetical protein M1818_008173 [Claussenomyces sp. TS43310]|nr:MAG: hypothetical protein M1818_008173 [Claussenomyces sp. TS43310]
MFRNPRGNASPSATGPLKPSIGRPPTPPNGSPAERKPASAMTTRSSPTNPLTPRPHSKINLPTLGRQGTKQVARGKTPGKPNASILSFFKKVDNPNLDDGELFIAQGSEQVEFRSYRHRSPSTVSAHGLGDPLEGEEEEEEEEEREAGRYNESVRSMKRRKIGQGSTDVTDASSEASGFTEKGGTEDRASPSFGPCTPPPPDPLAVSKPKPRRIGGFVDDSDSEDEAIPDKAFRPTCQSDQAIQLAAVNAEQIELQSALNVREGPGDIVTTQLIKQEDITENMPVVPEIESVKPITTTHNTALSENEEKPHYFGKREASMTRSEYTSPAPSFVPSLKQEQTSYSDHGGFEDMEDIHDDEFADGEELAERKWMEEQARLEAAENGEDYLDSLGDFKPEPQSWEEQEVIEACPICDAKLGSITADQASQHVNACLDGNPIPLPKAEVKVDSCAEVKLMPPGAGARFSRAAVARPGQPNPFEIDGAGKTASSAFSKLMSSKAEDVAWANAAAAEHAARGKPAYQRTCPFYKIMPGFFICVDAFRYGAVKGCEAYFLSHFHSDHYVGLTSSWCHGPIYCSKVTANLVKQQLRVDPKWVVPLDFEDKFNIPGTQGVCVTMIPANHCPGSSLFLFEKVVGKGDSPKVQRVLHCGDFRACPAHVVHPLLMPDIVDSITGRTKQQKIDVCYLDTTYLNPRYAFPSQEDVIKACADMCVSLKKERAEEKDAWEMMKKERAGAGMAKFIGGTPAIKSEDDSIVMSAVPSDKPRGRLLVVCGTYSIGKERICMGIARALDCKIWAPPGKQRICAALEDSELMSRLTDDPKKAQIHMQMLMEIRAETLQDYLNGYKPHFSRIVGFRPSGWNYRPPNSRFVESPAVSTVLHSENWRSRYGMSELVPQRGSTREASCFGVPYSEHSSFRELTMFCCALRIEKIVPTVNVGSAPGRAKMKGWIERWLQERRKNGVVKVGDGEGEVRW